MSEENKRYDARKEAIRIKKIRQGLVEDTENLEYLKEKEEKEKNPPTFKEKAANYWYHNKLFIIIGAFLIAAVSFLTYQGFTKERYDTTVMFCTYSYYDDSVITKLSTDFGKYMNDTDKNGEVNVGIFQASYSAPGEVPDQSGYEQALMSRIMSEVFVGENCIFICEKELMDSLSEKGVFADLRQVLGIKSEKPIYGINISNSPLIKDKAFDESRKNCYISIRVYKEGTDKDNYNAQINAVKALLKDANK